MARQRESAMKNPHSLRSSIMNKKRDKPKNNNNYTREEITIGRKIKHEKFGVGTIITITEAKNDKKITIAFDKQGVKTFMMSFTKLELL